MGKNVQTGKYKAWWKLHKGPILEPFDARKHFKSKGTRRSRNSRGLRGTAEQLEAQNKEDPISVHLEYKQEPEDVTEGEEVEE